MITRRNRKIDGIEEGALRKPFSYCHNKRTINFTNVFCLIINCKQCAVKKFSFLTKMATSTKRNYFYVALSLSA